MYKSPSLPYRLRRHWEYDHTRLCPQAADHIEGLEKELAESREKAKLLGELTARTTKECFKDNIDAVDKLGLDAMDAQPIFQAVQEWSISTGRARELIRCWALGTFDAASMLPPMADLGIGYDDDPAEKFAGMKSEVERLGKKTEELLDALESMVRQHCYKSMYGEVDSSALSANAEALEVLAEHGRFLIDRKLGRTIIGRWSGNHEEATIRTGE